MAFHIRDPETEAAVRELGRAYDAGLTETVKRAVKAELERKKAQTPAVKRLEAWRAANFPGAFNGPEADKAFYDSLNDE